MHTDTRASFVAGLLAAICLAPSPGRASPLEHGTSGSVQPGLSRTLSGAPSTPGSWLILASGRFGWTPSVLVEGDSRQRTGARLGLGYSPWSFLRLALSADVSADGYEGTAAEPRTLVVAALGDPRLSLGTGFALGAGFSLGGVFELWFPSGRGSFNFVGDSIGPTVALAASLTPESVPVGVHLNLGYRHDRSLRLLGDPSELTREQLLLSGATSAQHHLVVRLGVEYRIGPVAPFVEADADLPLDPGGLAMGPVVIAAGARVWLGPADVVQLTLAGEVRASPAPPAPDPANAVVWEDPPLLSVFLGVAFRLPVPADRGAVRTDEPVSTLAPPEAASAPRPGRVAGRVLCQGASCGRAARVTISGTGSSPLAPDDGTGAYASSDLPAGSYTVEASAQGHTAQSAQVAIEPGGSATADFDLALATTAEQPGIRGRVTDFEGVPVAATIRIPALGLELTADAEGGFETPADPGMYEVVISAPGFRTQTSRVEVTPASVVVMNVELRRRR